tara:strand:+ start:313 stop:1038 length:726 start_codon:yes stop_codon:yes gene_type:complete
MKRLITTGCSFSETICHDTWPVHLIKNLSEYELISKGMGSQGNGLIARSVIWEVSNQLSLGVQPENIIAGIEWSNPNRHEVYVDNPSQKNFNENTDGWVDNPTQFIDGYRNWEILNHSWSTVKSKLYYEHFYTLEGKFIETLENILRVQHFLEKYKIKYFMTTMQSIFPPETESKETQYLIDLINDDVFLPVEGMWEWARDHNAATGIPMHPDGMHPSSPQHIIFTDTIIMPFLKDRYGIY